MSQPISVHDNELLSYTVDCARRTIILRTAFRATEPCEFTDVVFSGVAAYHFESENFGTIIFDIAEEAVDSILADFRDLFAARKNYGWPDIHYENEQDLVEKLIERNVRGYSISSSYGMTGFVLAQKMQRFAANPEAR